MKREKASATKEIKIKKINNYGRMESRVRYNSKSSNIRFKEFYWLKLLC